MKTFGLIGGTSWHSTVEYYAAINRAINAWHGDNTNPPLILASLNQREVHALQEADDWDAIAGIFLQAARTLQEAGAEGIAICANTPHRIHDRLAAALEVPVLHIADAIADTVGQGGWQKVGLLGTRFTMEGGFLRDRLREKHGIETLVPAEPARHRIQDLVYEQLSVGRFEEEARQFFLEEIASLATRGAEAVILGCTEFPLLLKDTAAPLPLVDSLQSHCEMIVRFILNDEPANRDQTPT